MKNSQKSASDSQLAGPRPGADDVRRSSAESQATVASSVVSSLWNGATVVGNYVWSFWSPPQSTRRGLQALCINACR